MCMESHFAASSSIPGMHEYVATLPRDGSQGVRELAFARQMAESVGDVHLMAYIITTCKRRTAADRREEAYLTLANYSGDPAELEPLLDLPGHLGWHCAARCGEAAYLASDRRRTDKAFQRLQHFEDVDGKYVSAAWEITLLGMCLNHLQTGDWQINRGAAAIRSLGGVHDGLMQQRAALDWHRLTLHQQYVRAKG